MIISYKKELSLARSHIKEPKFTMSMCEIYESIGLHVLNYQNDILNK